jgi:hypothetical protein
MLSRKLWPAVILSFALACQQQPTSSSQTELQALRTEVSQLHEEVRKLQQPSPGAGTWQLVSGGNGKVYLLNTKTGRVFQGAERQNGFVFAEVNADSETNKKLDQMLQLLKNAGIDATGTAQTTSTVPK